MELNQKLFNFIAASPTPFHAVEQVKKALKNAGFQELSEAEPWHLQAGGAYFVTRGLSSLIALSLPAQKPAGFQIAASHSDFPAFKLKESFELDGEHYTRLNAERYGGVLLAPWLDRPLSIAGRLLVRQGAQITTKLVQLEKDIAIIPHVAIHMNRKANDGYQYDLCSDLVPLIGGGEQKGALLRLLAQQAGTEPENILGKDLFLCLRQPGCFVGVGEEFICAPRLDDLECAFGALEGFLGAKPAASAAVYCLFDNEEVGSMTKQGADSTFLRDTLSRAAAALGLGREEYHAALASTLMLSADNAHALHPNHPQLADQHNAPKMNEGIVIKQSANQKYTSDAVSTALFREICRRAEIPVQSYANRADMAGGSTLGNISGTHLSVNTVDIGLAQLAMHSCFETAGAKDLFHLAKACKEFFSTSVSCHKDGAYSLAAK